MKKRILVALLFLLSESFCFSQQSCPITVTLVSPNVSFAPGVDDDPWHSYLWVNYQNTSTKIVVAVRFSANYSDLLSEEERSFEDYTDEHTLKPEKKRNAYWGNGVYTHSLGKSVRVRVELLRVVFSDGSIWKSIDSSCSWSNRP